MKHLLFLLALSIGLAVNASAQTPPRLAPLLDTNTDASTQYLTTPWLPGNTGNLALQYVGTKISGTVAGSVKLQGTLDGVNYTYIGTDTLALANQATNTKIWDVSAQKRMKYRFEITTTGTVSLQNKGYYTPR